MAYDFVVVGAGMFGCAFARTMADRGKKILIVEQLPHVGGMCHTERTEGILVHTYGPHIFHTDDPRIWKWIQRFSDFYPFTLRTKALYEDRLYSLPINLMTLHQLWGVKTPAEARQRLEEVQVRAEDTASIEGWALSNLGREIYEKFIRGYSRKQWGREPASLPAGMLKRLPIRLTMDDNYFSDRYQGLPVGGYTTMFERMLEGIEVRLGVDFFADRHTFEQMGQVIYSGRMDRYFDYRLGELEFRSCRFQSKSLDGDHQGNPIINWSEEAYPWTRVTEHKHLENPGVPKTIVTWEYPFECTRSDLPLYPINDARNMDLYKKYAEIPTKAVFGGRLGSYRYRDMHQVIAEAWMLADRFS